MVKKPDFIGLLMDKAAFRYRNKIDPSYFEVIDPQELFTQHPLISGALSFGEEFDLIMHDRLEQARRMIDLNIRYRGTFQRWNVRKRWPNLT